MSIGHLCNGVGRKKREGREGRESGEGREGRDRWKEGGERRERREKMRCLVVRGAAVDKPTGKCSHLLTLHVLGYEVHAALEHRGTVWDEPRLQGSGH